MRWFFAIDEAGSEGLTGADAKLAVQTALTLGELEPVLIYHGKPNAFTTWMERHNVRVINISLSFITTIRTAESAGTYKAHSIGHWLRVMVPIVEEAEEFVLYTDCDVIFLNKVNWNTIRPRVFSAAPEFKKDNWNFFNAGVMVINVAAMRDSYIEFEGHIKRAIGSGNHYHYDDEKALNEFYRGQWERLSPKFNWKPYWGFEGTAVIIHFHGPKLNAIEMIINGIWPAENPTQDQLTRIVDGHIDAYIDWLVSLGERIQLLDVTLAVRMLNAANGLMRRKKTISTITINLDFLNFKMFPE